MRETPFERAFFAALLGAWTFALADALATQRGWGDGALHALYLAPWAVLGATGWAAAVTAARRVLAGASLGALAVAASLGAVANYAAVLGTRAFRNDELAALLATVVAGAVVAAAAGIYWLSAKVFARRPRVGAVLAVMVPVAVAAGLGWHNREGFRQLDRWVIGAPLVALAVFGAAWFALRFVPRSRVRAVVLAPGLALVGVVAAVAVGSARPSVVGRAADDGPWSKALARGVHLATDFDRDGSSSFFGGADCAPFDASVGPGKLEIPDDGIDNNCVGGDATADTKVVPPTWQEVPDEFANHNVLLITVEALRPDHTTFGGYERDTTPNLAKLAETSVVFDNFYASSTFTRLSLPSLFASRTPSQLEFEKQPKKKMPRLMESNPWLPQTMREAGLKTGAITANFSAFTSRDSLGLERGFTMYDSSPKIRYRGGTMRGFTAKKQVDEAIDFVGDGEKRFFLWVHFLEPHYKYERYPGAPKWGDEPIDLYDSEIWGVDHELGRLLDHLRKTKLLDETVVFLTGDHGEEFEEHGKRFHGSNLYEPQVRTVGLARVPGVEARRVVEPASTVDVAPTLANLARVRKDWERWSGRNLSPVMFGGDVEERPLVLETWSVTTLGNYMAAVVAWPYKGIWREKGASLELYDLARDREESENLADDDAHRSARDSIEGVLHGYIDRYERRYADPPATPKPESEEKQ